MLIITEQQDLVSQRVWTAKDKEDFCVKVILAYPKDGIDPMASFEECMLHLKNKGVRVEIEDVGVMVKKALAG